MSNPKEGRQHRSWQVLAREARTLCGHRGLWTFQSTVAWQSESSESSELGVERLPMKGGCLSFFWANRGARWLWFFMFFNVVQTYLMSLQIDPLKGGNLYLKESIYKVIEAGDRSPRGHRVFFGGIYSQRILHGAWNELLWKLCFFGLGVVL